MTGLQGLHPCSNSLESTVGYCRLLWRPESPIYSSYISIATTSSYTSNISQNESGNYSGLTMTPLFFAGFLLDPTSGA